MNIGHIIKQIRVSKKISQGFLANACEISQTYLSQIENGGKEPAKATLKKLSDFLGIPVPALVWLSIEENDVPKNKQRAFKMLAPTIESLVKSVFVGDN